MMPQMKAAFGGWQSKITLVRRIQSVPADGDGLVVTTDVPICFKGTIQPFGPQELMLKPEGQRTWEWLMVHTPPTVNLDPNDQIIINNKVFKVMGQNDYSQNGFIEYHLCKDYQ